MRGNENQAEMVSFSLDPQWCGLLFSVYSRHEKGGFPLPQPDAFAFSVAGPPLDADLIAWAGSFGFEICTVPSAWALVLESVKATGFLLVVGVGGLFCYKLFNLCWARTRNRLTSNASSNADGKDEDEPLNGQVQGEYFGPNTSSQESLLASPANDGSRQCNACGEDSVSSTEGVTSGDDDAHDADVSDGSPCEKQNISKRQNHNSHNNHSWRHPKHLYANRESSGCIVRRLNNISVLEPSQIRDVSLITPSTVRRNKKPPASFSEAIPDFSFEQVRLPRDESYDSLGFSQHIPRQGSFDSTSSDVSFDYSLPETIELEETNTLVSLDKLQQEIDSLKTNCLMMDEEFETIKCNRNFPGMSSLMKANTSHSSLATQSSIPDAETRDKLKQQKARACFAGLYSLTTIKNSTSSELSDSFPMPTQGRGSIGSAESLDWDSPKAVASPAKYTMGNVSKDTNMSGLDMSPHDLGETPVHTSVVKFGLEDLEEVCEYQASEPSPTTEESIGFRRKNSVSKRLRVSRQDSERKSNSRSHNMSEKSLAGSEDELMENLEWDEEDMVKYPEDGADCDTQTVALAMLPNSEDLELELSELPLQFSSLANPNNRSTTISPLTERSSKMESSGIDSKMADSMASMQSSQLFSDSERSFLPWGLWSSEESGYVECDPNRLQNRNKTQINSNLGPWGDPQSSTVSEQSTPASETLPTPVDMDARLPFQNIGPKVNILQYAVKEWHGNTPRAETILRGYAEIPRLLNLEHLRRIRGDNYCGIRAAIFQTLTQGLPLPSGENTYHCLANAIVKRGYSWLQDWNFAGRLPYCGNNVLHGMKTCLSSLDNVASLLSTSNDREEVLANLLNSDPSLDLHLVEGVKLQMLSQAIALHDANTSGQDVPLFAVLMFARDTSESPRDFMNNHLHQVGNTSGLEQVEMFLLGYTLGITLLIVRPAAHNTEDFICRYPDSNLGEWPQVILIAEDDRHYNVLVN